jgi:hypothetical protein
MIAQTLTRRDESTNPVHRCGCVSRGVVRVIERLQESLPRK